MSFLTAETIRNHQNEIDGLQRIIETGTLDRDSFIEGSAYNLQLGRIFTLDTTIPYIGPDGRCSGAIHYFEFNDPEPDVWFLSPGYYLLQSSDVVTIPATLKGIVTPRSTTFRYGMMIVSGEVHPGYSGELAVGCFIPFGRAIRLKKGAELFTLSLAEFDLDFGTDPYSGIYTGSKVTTEGVERAK